MDESTFISLTIGIFEKMTEKFPKEMEGRNGGYITLQEVGCIQPALAASITIVGRDIDEERFLSFEVNSKEKARRLAHLANQEDHVSSWQSRDFDNKKYGGAIATMGWVFSFSGLPELLDEYLMTHLAIELGMMQGDEVKFIASISENEYLDIAA